MLEKNRSISNINLEYFRTANLIINESL